MMRDHVEATALAIVVAIGLVMSAWIALGWGVGLGVLAVLVLLGGKAAREDREKAEARRRRIREASWRFGGRDLR